MLFKDFFILSGTRLWWPHLLSSNCGMNCSPASSLLSGLTAGTRPPECSATCWRSLDSGCTAWCTSLRASGLGRNGYWAFPPAQWPARWPQLTRCTPTWRWCAAAERWNWMTWSNSEHRAEFLHHKHVTNVIKPRSGSGFTTRQVFILTSSNAPSKTCKYKKNSWCFVLFRRLSVLLF